MGNCRCKDSEWLDMVFGLVIFAIVLFTMKEKAILLFEQTEWYRALAVTLGGIISAGALGIVSSFSRVWIIENIRLIMIVSSIVWAIRFVMIEIYL